VFAAATALLLGAAIAEVGDGSARTLLLWAMAAFLGFVAAGGAWAMAVRRGPTDAVVERAQTASRLAHELRNPLMSIKGLAATGTRLFDQMDDEERRDFFRLIDEEAARLKRVAEQSATALKFDADQIAYDRREEDLGALVEEVTWSTPHGQHPMTVETTPGILVEVDRRHLAEAIANLVDNAAKYSPPDAPIEVTAGRSQDGEAVIEIADRGPGIPLERTDQVFERFARWRPAGYEETQGAGLGLFIARGHVLAHGGQVAVLEREDGGSILRVTLPAER
jgi:two-component system sensor histidine kinase KdpD